MIHFRESAQQQQMCLGLGQWRLPSGVAHPRARGQPIEKQPDTTHGKAGTFGEMTNENPTLKAAQAKQDANPGLVAMEATTDAPVPFSARLRALVPWVLAMLAIVAVIVLLAWLR